MRKYTILIILLMVPLLACAQSDDGWGIAWTWADSTIEVDASGVKGVRTIAAAVNIAGESYTIIIHPGIYTEKNIVINDSVKFIADGGIESVTWQGDSLLFSLATDGVMFEGIYFKGLLDGELANIGSKDVTFRNCTFECSTWTICEHTDSFVDYFNVRLLGRKPGGLMMTAGNLYTDEYFHIGVPVNKPVGPYFGLTISGGLFHAADKVNIYSRSDTTDGGHPVLDITGGAVALQGGALIANQGGACDNPAVRVSSDGTFLLYYGDVANNSADSAAIAVYGTATATLRSVHVENTGGGNSYLSESSGISYLEDCIFDGALTLGDNDLPLWSDGGRETIHIKDPEIYPDSTIILSNMSGHSWTITKVLGSCDADNFDFEIGVKSLIGAAEAITVFDTLDCSVNGADGVTFWRQVTKTTMDAYTVPNNNGVFYKAIGAETPDYLTIHIEWRVDN